MASEKWILTKHAKERIEQRLGIMSDDIALSWVSEAIKGTKTVEKEGDKNHYITDTFRIICDGFRVVTVIPKEDTNEYIDKFNYLVGKEYQKQLVKKERELRKAEIEVYEKQLNYLKAKNPNTIDLISKQIVQAIDLKKKISDSIQHLKQAAQRYGIEV